MCLRHGPQPGSLLDVVGPAGEISSLSGTLAPPLPQCTAVAPKQQARLIMGGH